MKCAGRMRPSSPHESRRSSPTSSGASATGPTCPPRLASHPSIDRPRQRPRASGPLPRPSPLSPQAGVPGDGEPSPTGPCRRSGAVLRSARFAARRCSSTWSRRSGCRWRRRSPHSTAASQAWLRGMRCGLHVVSYGASARSCRQCRARCMLHVVRCAPHDASAVRCVSAALPCLQASVRPRTSA